MRYLFLITLLCTGIGLLKAQQMSSFQKALHHYESELDIKFSYDPSLIERILGDFERTQSLEAFISLAETSLPIQVLKISKDYYTVAVIESQYSLTLTDSLESSAIKPPFFVLINSNPIDIEIANDKALFSYKPSLSDTIIAYAPGYAKRLMPVDQLISKKDLSLQLMTQTYLLNDVLIEDYITKGINMDPTSQKITIDLKNLPLLPGETDGDIFASLAALPGIATPDGRPGNLFIRGTSVDQSLILFDNIPIYHRGHYYGTISPYNPKVVDHVEVYRSGYHPRMGGRVGGAIFVNSDTEVTNKPQYGVGMNTLYAMVYGKTPIANNKIGLTLGARHSYPTAVKSPKLNAISESVYAATGLADDEGNILAYPDVTFQDYHVKLIVNPHTKHKISVSGIYSNTNLRYKSPVALANDIESTDFENFGINTEWEYQINESWSSTLINTYSKYGYNNNSEAPTITFFAVNDLTDYNSRFEIANSGVNTHGIQLGLDYKWQSTGLNYKNLIQLNEPPIEFASIQRAHTFSPYANIEWLGFENWFLQLGLRGTYYSPKSSFQWSPRLAANFSATSWLNLKATAGLYHQFLSQVKNLEFGNGGFDNELWMLAGEMNGNIISGEQYMAGFMINSNSWLLDIEGYYKTANGVTYYEDRRFNDASGYFTADDLIYGIDTYLKKGVGEYTSVWAGYSYSNSKITLDTTNLTTYKSKYVQPHTAYIGTAYQKDRWKFSATWKFGSGLNAKSLEIAFAQVIYERAQASRAPGSPQAPDPFADLPERYPNIHSLDLSASYKIPCTDKRPWSASFGLSVINVYDRNNLIDRAFRGNPPPPRFIDRRALGFAPNLMVTIEW
ncbi:MAG: TonB-dependent receptor plug domain-containing protein [Reichenbachiella sp.]|uniref:TonB-dependent receptor plug domain-containing protein n=1 Tax=Reichenbachiella sp. TaxID=2184521 RepID=UPI0032987AE7